MKKLICTQAVEALAKKGKKVICIDKDTLITPAARDVADAHGMTFSASTCCCGEDGHHSGEGACCTSTQEENPLSSEKIFQAMQALAAQGMFKGMFDEAPANDTPYTAEYDKSGFKVVRGGTVKMEVLETGNPADDGKVMYQELIGSNDKSSMNAGFMTITNCTFDWDVQCEEIYYVVNGAITITIDGKSYTAHQGDSLFIQNGSKVVFSAEGSVKVFYATY